MPKAKTVPKTKATPKTKAPKEGSKKTRKPRALTPRGLQKFINKESLGAWVGSGYYIVEKVLTGTRRIVNLHYKSSYSTLVSNGYETVIKSFKFFKDWDSAMHECNKWNFALVSHTLPSASLVGTATAERYRSTHRALRPVVRPSPPTGTTTPGAVPPIQGPF